MTTDLPPVRSHLPAYDMMAGLSPTLADVLRKTVRNITAMLGGYHCAVALFDPTRTKLVTIASSAADEQPQRVHFHPSDGIASWIAEHREGGVINDCAQDARFQWLAVAGSIACVPLVDQDDITGLLAASSPQINTFSEQHLRTLSLLAEQVMLMVACARQSEQSNRQWQQVMSLWRTVMASSFDGIALLDMHGRFIEANDAFGTLSGIHPRQLVKLEFQEVLGFSAKSGVSGQLEQSIIHQAIQQQQPVPYTELDVTLQNNMPVSLGISLTPVLSDGETVYVLLARDVTAIRDFSGPRGRFLSMITHELRSPINAINGYLDLALADVAGSLNEQQREFIQRARSGSENLFALVEDLLLVSRANAGQLRLNREIISMQEVVINAVEEMELTAKDRGITISIDMPEPFPYIYADAGRLQQVLRNLLSNALRFTPIDGHVTITAGVEGEVGTGDQTGRNVVLRVTDTGCGIAPEDQERIFERFFQVANKDNGHSGGQGLGLAIVKMIVELHGGVVFVQSMPGEGSTFTCILPVLLPDSAEVSK